MPLKSIQLAAINPRDRAGSEFEVVVHTDDGNQIAMFDCTGEDNAIKLRDAIRDCADRLRLVADYRPRPVVTAEQVQAYRLEHGISLMDAKAQLTKQRGG